MRHAPLLLMGCVLWGCSDFDPVPDGRPISLVIRPGTRISPSGEWVSGDGEWALAGERVYYVAVSSSGGRSYVASVRAAGGDHQIMPLGQVTPAFGGEGGFGRPALLQTLAPLPDGTVLCAAWSDTVETAVRGLLRWDGADSVTWLSGVQGVVSIALSSDPRYLLLRTGDGVLRGYDLTTGISRSIGPGDPFAFAPEAPDVFYRTDGDAWAVASLADGSRRTVPLTLAEDDELAIDAHWGDDGIRLLTQTIGRGASTYAVVDVTSGQRTVFYESSFEGSSFISQWLPDGRRMALWQSVLTDPCSFSSGCEPHVALYLIEIADGSETWIAGVRGILGSRLVYAPDGRRAVYNAEGVLYLLWLS